MKVRQMVLGAALAIAAAGVVIAASAEDDLAVVKRAVARQQVARPAAPASTSPATAAVEEPVTRRERKDEAGERRSDARSATGGRDLRWFKVRITDKGSQKTRVSVNVPIALVRALGEDFPIDIGRHGEWRGTREGREKMIRLGEVLATLEAGHSLVEIDDDDATVRIWVE
jgi:hypothetical protein